jgi:hypothetical protein
MPVVDVMFAIDGALLVQVPPLVASVSVVVVPTQVCSVPLMAAGRGFTVTVRVA